MPPCVPNGSCSIVAPMRMWLKTRGIVKCIGIIVSLCDFPFEAVCLAHPHAFMIASQQVDVVLVSQLVGQEEGGDFN